MMDFGLAGLFDRFEKDFGRPLTLALEALIGLAVASVCFGLIWGFLKPIVSWAASLIQQIVERQIGTSAIELALLLVFTASMTMSIMSARWIVRDRKRLVASLRELSEENEAQSAAITDLSERFRSLLHSDTEGKKQP
jgi:hypothetical protein